MYLLKILKNKFILIKKRYIKIKVNHDTSFVLMQVKSNIVKKTYGQINKHVLTTSHFPNTILI